ncbi:MAG: transglycosylase domain-containing protein [Hyphomicrobiaceae bacterium]|nr:transglycosylase domain-containing protein [Hyphomicrobiaceae bacterium]
MIALVRLFTRLIEIIVAVPARAVRVLIDLVAFNPRLGPLRHVVTAAVVYVLFAVMLVYVVAPLRGIVGAAYTSEKLHYDAERWLATAIYDTRGSFVGTFDPRLDSQRDVNFTDAVIEHGDYVANPDHKSIPVRDVPEHYWSCLVYHEDRNLGGPLNPFGIDLLGVLKIPYTTVKQSIASRRPRLGVGGSTLPMQLARVIRKTPPSASEGGFTKLGRKLSEWWEAPVIYRSLTAGGDDTKLRQWAANHLWLAQRTGGSPLHGVEVTSRIVFGKEAQDLSMAEQFVLASAVNKPIILLEGSERLNEVRLDRWRYITEVRARTCAEKLIADPEQQKQVVFELVQLASGPPDPHVRPRLQKALETFAPEQSRRAQANPTIRANVLMPAARFGLREEMKQRFGFGWRDYVRGVTTTFDVPENLAFHSAVGATLTSLDAKLAGKLGPGYTLAPAKAGASGEMPNVVVVAANARGEIVRYFESGETAPYFGSQQARSAETGFYNTARESRMIASTGKMIAAIGIANQHTDTISSLYLDTDAPPSGLETCRRGGGGRHGRKAIVAFACSLNTALIGRTARVGQARIKALIDRFGFTMPPRDANGEGTPPSTAAVMGQIAGSPRRVHQMSAVVLAALTGQSAKPVGEPTLVKSFDFIDGDSARLNDFARPHSVSPRLVVNRGAGQLVKALLEAPLCYSANNTSHGTLKSLAHWCAARHPGLRLHFAKTGTQVNADPDASIDTWITGGLQFTNGAAYSYVVLVGTGSPTQPFGRAIHAADVAPLVETLLADLEKHAKANPEPSLLPAVAPVAQGTPANTASRGRETPSDMVLQSLLRQ